MPDIFEFDDYRPFIKAYYAERKSANRNFSFRFIAGKVGFKSPSFFSQILKGQTNLSHDMTMRFIEFLGLRKREAEYFELLVLFNQAREETDRRRYLKRLSAFRNSRVNIMEKDRYAYYEKWYHTAIRELLFFYPFKGDFRQLGKMVNPPIKAPEAKESIELLMRLGLVKKNAQGGWIRSDSDSVSTGLTASAPQINLFHAQTLDLAKAAIHQPREKRSLSTLTMSLSENGFKSMESELARFRRRLMEIAAADAAENRVYQINFQIFPVTQAFPEATDG